VLLRGQGAGGIESDARGASDDERDLAVELGGVQRAQGADFGAPSRFATDVISSKTV
jgi:hypothetical protein